MVAGHPQEKKGLYYIVLSYKEVLRLKWDAIDFKNNTISIKHTVTSMNIDGKHLIIAKDRTKNKSSCRTLPLVAEFHDFLTDLKSKQQENQAICKSSYNKEQTEYVCVDEMGNLMKPNYITQNFQITLRNNNLRRIRFHDLRHTAASLLLKAGVGMKDIQEWLGHSDFGTTANIYGHLDADSKLRSANSLLETGVKLSAPA